MCSLPLVAVPSVAMVVVSVGAAPPPPRGSPLQTLVLRPSPASADWQETRAPARYQDRGGSKFRPRGWGASRQRALFR